MQTTSHVRPQNELYERGPAEYAAALDRLARGYDVDPDKRRDLPQEIHLALWRSFELFRADCSLRSWVYRVAHNMAVSWVTRQKQDRSRMLVSLEEVEMVPVPPDADRRLALQRLTHLVQRLKPEDRKLILACLEGMEAAEIGELTGISARKCGNARFIGSRISGRGTSTSQDTMPNELNPKDPRNLWQSQERESVTITLEEIRLRAPRFERRIWWRNFRKYAAGVLLIAWFLATLHFSHGLDLLVPVLLTAGVVYIMIQLRPRGTTRSLPADADTRSSVEFHRLELER